MSSGNLTASLVLGREQSVCPAIHSSTDSSIASIDGRQSTRDTGARHCQLPGIDPGEVIVILVAAFLTVTPKRSRS